MLSKTVVMILVALAAQGSIAETVREKDERIAAQRADKLNLRNQILEACKQYGELLQVAWDHRAEAMPPKPQKLLDMDSEYGDMLRVDLSEARGRVNREAADLVRRFSHRALEYDTTRCYHIRNRDSLKFDLKAGDDGRVFNPKAPVFAPWFDQAKFNAMLADYEWNFNNPGNPR